MLPYLAWFEGGVFEQFLLDFAELESEAWGAIRGELVATALIRVEELPQFASPFLRFHPTLAFGARAGDVRNPEIAEERFLAVYLDVGQMAGQALSGSRPAAGMALLAREEANFRSALASAFRRDRRREGARLADTLREYLERAGRLREHDALVEWMRSRLPEDAGLDEATCEALRQHAMSLLSHGRTDEAVAALRRLIARLEAEGLAGGDDPTFQIAVSHQYLLRAYTLVRRPDLALEPAGRAVALFEGLLGDAALGNLAAALGDLASAQRVLGRFEEALANAERALEIMRALGRDREIAADLGRIAEILADQQRYAEADARYADALRAARVVGDLGLQAFLQQDLGQPGRAIEFGKEALGLFQRAGNRGGEIETCDLLGSAEMVQGHLDAAEAWYVRSRELAEGFDDRYYLAIVAQNIGILHQTRAERTDDPEARDLHLRRAVASIEESLAESRERDDQVNAASSYFQLGVLQHMLGDLELAEEQLRRSLEIYEPLNHPEVYKVYANLADVARDRGAAEAAAEWQVKYESKVAELDRLRRGGGDAPAGLEARLAPVVLAVARAAYEARARGGALPPEAAEGVAQLQALPAPFGDAGAFLDAVAAGGPVPAVPAGLPTAVAEILGKLKEAVEASG